MNKIIEEIRNDEKLGDIIDELLDMYFDSDENLQYALEEIMEGGKTDYEMVPIATDGTGGVYVILNGSYVGYISTEGQAGIIASTIEDYFKICFGTKYGWYDVFAEGSFDSFANFSERIKWSQNCTIDNEMTDDDLDYLNEFIIKYNLDADLKTVYKLFKKGIMIQPEFIIEPTLDEYESSDDFFGSDHTFLENLLSEK